MACSIIYNDKKFTEEEFRDYISSNPEEFSRYTNPDENIFDSSIGYDFKAVDLLDSDKAIERFKTGEKNGWSLEKILTELQIPKAQKDLILTFGTNDREEIVTQLLANYSYTVEINVSVEPDNKVEDNSYGRKTELVDEILAEGKLEYLTPEFEEELDKRYEEEKKIATVPSNIYEKMTVPGGVNYRENEIRTPDITPSIKGHAQFSTSNGIGWFRSDDKTLYNKDNVRGFFNPETQKEEFFEDGDIKATKTRRILEIQSDLFQKGRDKKSLIPQGVEEDASGLWRPKDESSNNPKNQFLQLLNKDNNWVSFFVKSIIQDSARKGYEKVLFPTGTTAAKVEGHDNLEDFIDGREDMIRLELETKRQIEKGESFTNEGIHASSYPDDDTYIVSGDKVSIDAFKEFQRIAINRVNSRIEQFKREIEQARLGNLAVSSVAKFYENTINNILEKRGYKPERIKDEYGNEWYQVDIKPEYEYSLIFDSSIHDIEQDIRKAYKPFTYKTWENGTIQLNGRSNQLNRGRIAQEIMKKYGLNTLKGAISFSEKQSKDLIKYRTITIDREGISRLLAPQGQLFDSSISDLEAALKSVTNDQERFESQLQRLLDESSKVKKVIGQIKEESIRSKLRDSLRYINEENTDLKNFVYFLLEAQEVLKYYSESLKKVNTLPTEEAIAQLSSAEAVSRSFRDMITFLKRDFRYVENSNQFKALVDNLSNYYDQIQNIYAAEAEALGSEIIKNELESDAKVAFEKLQKELVNMKEQVAKASNAGAKDSYVKKLQDKVDTIQKRMNEFIPDGQMIDEAFKGLRGDLNWFSGNFRSALTLGDPIISGYARRLKRGYNTVRSNLAPIRNQAQDQLNAYIKGVGVNTRQSMQKFYEDLYKIDTIESYNDKGEKETDSYYSLQGPINQQFFNDNLAFQKQIKDAKKGGDLDEIQKAQNEYSEWLNKYAERLYVEAWYDRYNLLTPEAADARQEIIQEINNILRGPNRDTLSDTDYERVNDLKYQLKRLSSTRTDNGELKTGKDLEIAKSIQAFNKETNKMATWQTTPENKRWFDIIVAKKKDQVDKGLITQEDFDNWWANNTQRVIAPEFYKARQIIIEKIQSIMSKLPKDVFKDDIKSLWESIFDVSKPYRDEDNIIVGNDLSDEQAAIIKSDEEKMEELKAKLVRFSGLTIDEEKELSGLWGALDTLTDDELNRFNELRDRKAEYKDYLGQYISDLEKNALLKYFGDLGKISKWVATTYYTSTYNKQLMAFKGEVDPANLQTIEEIEPRFKQESKWYKDNHITKVKKKFEDGKTFFVDEIEPIYIWKDIIPTNEDWILEDQPGFAFKTRIVKPEFTNKNYEASNYEYFRTLDSDEFKVMPKKYINDDGEVKLSSYINKDYERLKNSTDTKDQAKFKMLQFLINTHLTGQQKLPDYKKLGYFLPGITKSKYDRTLEGGLRGVGNSIKDNFRVTQTDKDLTLGDISQVDLSIIPVKFSTKVKPEDQDLDLLGSILKHRAGVEEYSYLEKELPNAKLIQSALRTAPGDVSQSQIDKILALFKLDKFIKPSKETRRSRTFDSFLRTMFYGETEVSPFGNDVWNKRINNGFAAATLQVMTFNFPAHVTNILSGEVQNIIEASAGKYMTLKDYGKAKAVYLANVRNFWNDYGVEGNQSKWTSIAHRLDVPQGEFIDHLGHKTRFSRLRDIKNHIMFIKQGGEHEIQITTMIAMALNRKVKIGNEILSLDNALNINNGVVSIKPGAKNMDGTNFTENDLNKFQDQVHSIVRQLNGAYSKIDKSVAEKSFLGKLAFYMRKYMLPMAYRRFEPFKYDYEEQEYKQGYYQIAWRILGDLWKINADIVRNWDTYRNLFSELEKRNLRRFLSEVLIIAMLYFTISAMGGYDDDRELKGRWWHTMVLYELMKVKSEAETLLPGPGFNEISSFFSSPFVPATTAKTAKNLLFNTVGAVFGDPDARYKRPYGIWEEGDLRLKADALKLLGVPINLLTPENMVKNFELRNR